MVNCNGAQMAVAASVTAGVQALAWRARQDSVEGPRSDAPYFRFCRSSGTRTIFCCLATLREVALAQVVLTLVSVFTHLLRAVVML